MQSAPDRTPGAVREASGPAPGPPETHEPLPLLQHILRHQRVVAPTPESVRTFLSPHILTSHQ
eukprot:SAG11_NODE_119_length_15911_cov_7.077599_7_plen_63_part_00